jgi:hypothetical protein
MRLSPLVIWLRKRIDWEDSPALPGRTWQKSAIFGDLVFGEVRSWSTDFGERRK